MIINANDPGAHLLTVFDTVTGEKLNSITRVNTTTGEAWGYVMDANGKPLTQGDSLAIVQHPNPVRIEPPVLS